MREYLLFRGFGNTLKSFDTELKTDKDKGFRVDKIIDQITHSIYAHDLQSLRDIWNHLDGHLFSKLEHSFATGEQTVIALLITCSTYVNSNISLYFLQNAAVKKLEFGLLKFYLVAAFAAGKQEKITEFFTKLAPELHSQSEWKEWFCKFSYICAFTSKKKRKHKTHFVRFQFFHFAKIPMNIQCLLFVLANNGKTHCWCRCTIFWPQFFNVCHNHHWLVLKLKHFK